MKAWQMMRRCVEWMAGGFGSSRSRAGATIFKTLNMAWVGQALFATTRLGIPRLLADGPKTAAELARLTNAHERRIDQMLRALAGFDMFDLRSDGRYGLTAVSRLLVDDDSWLRAYVELWGTQLYAAGGCMLDMARTDRTAFDIAYGCHIYEHYKKDAEAGKLFVKFMNLVTEWQAKNIVDAIDFGPYRTMVDVGCGRAYLATEILKRNPHLRATIFDQPHMSELVEARLAENDLTSRCTFVGGSFFESVPSGGELYTIKHVIHDWEDEQATAILRSIAAAMPPASRLIVIEGVLDARNGRDQVVKMRDLEQMIWGGGAVRTEREFRGLFDAAGLDLTGIERTSIVDCRLISARKRG